MSARKVMFRSLPRNDAHELLAKNHVGRIAYSLHDHIDIEPVNYVYVDGMIHARTAPGSKLTTLLHHRYVAFEVDEIRGLFDWRSVVVHGAVYIVENDGDAMARDAYRNTLAALRTLLPDTLTDDDPTPSRSVLFRIHLESITGREAVETKAASHGA